MNKEQRLAELRAELKALEEEVKDPIHKRAQEILDIIYPDRKTFKENGKYLPLSANTEEYHGAKVFYVSDKNTKSEDYTFIGYIYTDHYYGREEETEVEVPKSFFEAQNLKEHIYMYFFNKNKEERLNILEGQIEYKKKEMEKLQGQLMQLVTNLIMVKKEYGDE